jgi:hypothetical protein
MYKEEERKQSTVQMAIAERLLGAIKLPAFSSFLNMENWVSLYLTAVGRHEGI